jgi:hypothetical protein
MSNSKIFSPTSPWHATHKLRGQVWFHRFGPGGRETCTTCGAQRWTESREISPDCGGSVEYDSRAAKPCKPLTKGHP